MQTRNIAHAFLLMVSTLVGTTNAFITPSSRSEQCVHSNNRFSPSGPADSSLQMGKSSPMDDFLNFFDFGKQQKGASTSSENDLQEDDDDADLPAGEVRIATIPVTSIRPGGLRLYLMLYLMGMQNTPEPKSWKADQPTTDDYALDFWYHDQSAVLSVTLEPNQIVISRVGSNPSTAYIMQESVIVRGVLDELQSMATPANEDVDPENRLLVPQTPDAIEKARDALAFG